MHYLFALIASLFFLTAAPHTSPLTVRLFVPTPASLGADTTVVSRQLTQALSAYNIVCTNNREADFAIAPTVRLRKATYVENPLPASAFDLALDLDLIYLPTGEVVSSTTLDLEAQALTPMRAHQLALQKISAQHPQLQSWAYALPMAVQLFRRKSQRSTP